MDPIGILCNLCLNDVFLDLSKAHQFISALPLPLANMCYVLLPHGISV